MPARVRSGVLLSATELVDDVLSIVLFSFWRVWLPGYAGKQEEDESAPTCGEGHPIADARRIEVVVEGAAQFAVDTTFVCALHADGRPQLGAAKCDSGAPQKNPLSTRNWLVPQPSQGGSGSRGGSMARVHVRGVSCHSRDIEQSKCGVLRWRVLWACAVAKVVAFSLLDLFDSHGGDGKTPQRMR